MRGRLRGRQQGRGGDSSAVRTHKNRTSRNSNNLVAANVSKNHWNNVRGQKEGRWVPSEGYEYVTFIKSACGKADRMFREKRASTRDSNTSNASVNEFMPATYWKWQDQLSEISKFTSSRDEFCQVLQALQLRRVLLFGDSVSLEMANSLLMLLGYAGAAAFGLGWIEIDCTRVVDRVFVCQK